MGSAQAVANALCSMSARLPDGQGKRGPEQALARLSQKEKFESQKTLQRFLFCGVLKQV
ncbi:hypothetical protein [Mucilaginibacter sp. PPCGB 2223]|uniref:hypothetical protein n=1 Tax=Mucilaginibacter sp. PPCGB 2223 TaxID=1886027 RepID=UPI001586C9A2|nr:hypothetical protein [Mucilaginibacter sp. PPCGB 2223]